MGFNKTHYRTIKQKGFTLIELLVVIIIIGILFTTLTALFNPLGQITKAQNATRQQDINQIKNALDTYYNDKGCYPTSLPFGGKWSAGTTVYMEKVPEDPSCSSGNPQNCYLYQTDGTTCPQWDILYASMHTPINTSIPSCTVATTCPPLAGMKNYNYCSISGKLNCTYITQNPLPTPTVPSSSGTSSNATPTPAPTSICNNSTYFTACSNHNCNSETYTQCLGCGGAMNCYVGYPACGGVTCP